MKTREKNRKISRLLFMSWMVEDRMKINKYLLMFALLWARFPFCFSSLFAFSFFLRCILLFELNTWSLNVLLIILFHWVFLFFFLRKRNGGVRILNLSFYFDQQMMQLKENKKNVKNQFTVLHRTQRTRKNEIIEKKKTYSFGVGSEQVICGLFMFLCFVVQLDHRR